MLAKGYYKKYLKPRPLSITVLLLIIFAGLMVYGKTSRSSKNQYSLAEELPRGAVVYVQFRDLPALIKQWNESSLKEQYLASTSYGQLQHRHLAMKLISRWEEFNSALGFEIDSAAIAGSTEAAAAIAIYDIGRLDLVLIAPMSEEKIAASRFFKTKDEFDATELPDGSTYYGRTVEADRGRQKQTLVFAMLKGRFILATDEKLLLRTIANLNHQSKKDSLFDDPSFKTLTTALAPHYATVWVDQAKLNRDYYFKHYWLMQNAEQLKGIHAGLFDLEMQDGKWIERREFLTTDTPARSVARKRSGISPSQVEDLRAMIPADVPLLKLFSVSNDAALAGSLARDTLFDRIAPEGKRRSRLWSWQSYDGADDGESYADEGDDDDDDSYNHYAYLDSSYDIAIDDPHDAKISEREKPGGNPLAVELDHQFVVGLQQAVSPAQPLSAALATSPHTVAGPLFVEFRKVFVLTLQAPENLRRELLESAISAAAQGHLTIAGPTANMKWVSHDEGGRAWRSLELPMLGWGLCYAVRDHALIIANSESLLQEVMATQIKTPADGRAKRPAATNEVVSNLDDLTVIRLDQRKEAFDDIMKRLDAESIKARQRANKEGNKDADEVSEEFFSGSIASLLNVISNVRSVEIKRRSSPNRLHEQLDFILK